VYGFNKAYKFFANTLFCVSITESGYQCVDQCVNP
jgi:hypothetical protein